MTVFAGDGDNDIDRSGLDLKELKKGVGSAPQNNNGSYLRGDDEQV